MSASDGLYRVGEVARRTGVTVRTLHHYDEIGLLSPSHRAGGGHRLYTAADLGRLQQVLSLRQLGFSLNEVRECLNSPGFDPLTVLRLHLARAREVLKAQHELCGRLERLTTAMSRAEEVSADEFLQTVEATMSVEEHLKTAKEHFHLPPGQAEALAAHWAKFSQADIEAVQNEWPVLIAELRAAMEAGTDPAGSEVQALAARTRELTRMFTGDNPSVSDQLKHRYETDPDLQAKTGWDAKLWEYVGRAHAAAKKEN
jgi:DNA-binding transcriptional MerR regulator